MHPRWQMNRQSKVVISFCLFAAFLGVAREVKEDGTEDHIAAASAAIPRTSDDRVSRGGDRSEDLPEDLYSTHQTIVRLLEQSTSTTTSTTSTPRSTSTIVRKQTSTTVGSQPGNGRQWMSLIQQYPWDSERAYRIMMCESGGNPNAVNKSSGATGLFQIHPGGSKYLDPAANVATAYGKYQRSGWRPWVCKG